MPGRRWEAALWLYLFGGDVSPGALPVLAAGAEEGVGRGILLTLITGSAPHPRGALAEPQSSAAVHPSSSILPAKEQGGTSLGKGIKLLERAY